MTSDEFWKLGQLSDVQLLEGLGHVLLTQRRALAALVAHLGEVEDRRLHLEAAHSSMFDYCVARLHMSEDEACRRIELARLARRFSALFPLLASGEISLSVALLLKPVLTSENHGELLQAARGHSLRQARELVAARFPRPDVPSTVRKLPERRAESAVRAEAQESLPQPVRSVPTPAPLERHPASETAPRSRVEPLSPQRYKIQFTADGEFKEKLEQARDLLRHAHPTGDVAEILARALDLLIADQMKRRFGAAARPKVSGASRNASATPSRATAAPGASAMSVSRAARREVLVRDGLRCTWVSANGKRCNSSAWLELDHRHPRGKGGGSQPENLRVLCRAHNRFAAEREYGREHIDGAIAARQGRVVTNVEHSVAVIRGVPAAACPTAERTRERDGCHAGIPSSARES